MPTNVCLAAYDDCMEENEGDDAAREECGYDIKSQCGTLDPATAGDDTSNGPSQTLGAPVFTSTSESTSGLPTSTGSPVPTTGDGDGASTPMVAIIAGAVAGFVVLMGLIGFIFYRLGARRRQQQREAGGGSGVGDVGDAGEKGAKAGFERMDSREDLHFQAFEMKSKVMMPRAHIPSEPQEMESTRPMFELDSRPITADKAEAMEEKRHYVEPPSMKYMFPKE
jgi:hypothetical protein